MKKVSAVQIGIAALALCFPLAGRAQTETLVYGRANLTLTPSLLQTISAAGAVVTDLAGNPLENGASPFQLYGGYLDLKTTAAEGIGHGGFQIALGGQTLRAQDFIYTNGPGGQYFSANIILNGAALGRTRIFQFASPISGPTQLQNGVLQFSGSPFTLDPSFVGLVNSRLKQGVLSATAEAGTLSEYIVYVPDTAGIQN